MKKFWKAEILQMAESDIFDIKLGVDHDAAIPNWLRPRFVDLQAFLCPKNDLQKALKKPVVNALFGKPLRPNGDCDVTETHLE